MNAERLLALYDRVADAPDAVTRLRRFVLDLAVRGKLVEQDPKDEPAPVLLERIAAEKVRLVETGEIKRKAARDLEMVEPLYRLPSSWRWVALGEIFQYDAGTKREPRSLDPSFWLLELEDIERESGRLLARVAVSEREPKSTKSEFRTDDVLYGKLRPYLTKALVADEPGYSTTEIVAIRPFLPLCSEYCALALRRPDFTDYVTRLGQGTKMPRLRTDDAVVSPFPLPPVAEQRRIVARVKELMVLLDRLEEARNVREATRDRLTAASLARLTAPGATDDVPAHARFTLDVLPVLTTGADQIKLLRQTILSLAVQGKLTRSSKGEISTVGRFRKLQNGYAFKSGWFSKSGMRLLRNANVGHGELRWGDVVYLPNDKIGEFERFRLREGDVVLTLDRPFISTGVKVARVSSADLPSLLLQRVGRFLEVNEGLADDYLFIWINSLHFSEQVNPGRSNGVPHISSIQVEAAEIYVPCLAEQHRIVGKVDALTALCDRLESALHKADTTRARLLDTLIYEALSSAALDVRETAA